MIRTKHFVLVLGVLTLVLSGVGLDLLTNEVTGGEISAVSFSVPEDTYPVFRKERDARAERRSAFIASVREALRTDPVPEPEPEPVSPQVPEEVRVAVPSGHGVWSYGDATLTEEPEPVSALPSPAPMPAGTSTQPEHSPTPEAGIQ